MYRLIAFDLDGTALNSKKELTPETRNALKRAASRGIELVPATGRFYRGMPEAIRSMPFIHYAITMNGAVVYDIQNDRTLYGAEIPWQRAVEIMEEIESPDLIYDSYIGSWGWITRAYQEKAADYVPDQYFLRMLTVLRTPVDELKAYIRKEQRDVQKIIMFTRTLALQQELLKTLPQKYPDVVVTSSVPHNLELNAPDANKGAALHALAKALGISIYETMAIGDGLNDAALLKAAGLSIAMGNAHPDILALADEITADCDHNGVAQAIEKFT